LFVQFVTEATKYLLKLILAFDRRFFIDYKYAQTQSLFGLNYPHGLVETQNS